jgi:hypothetical protein
VRDAVGLDQTGGLETELAILHAGEQAHGAAEQDRHQADCAMSNVRLPVMMAPPPAQLGHARLLEFYADCVVAVAVDVLGGVRAFRLHPAKAHAGRGLGACLGLKLQSVTRTARQPGERSSS